MTRAIYYARGSVMLVVVALVAGLSAASLGVWRRAGLPAANCRTRGS